MKDRNNDEKLDDFQLNIPDEAFNTLPEMNLTDTGPSFKTSAKEMEGSSTKAYYSDKERKMNKKEHKSRDKVKSIKNRRVFRLVWWAMVVLVALTVASYLITGSNDLFAVGRTEGKTQVEIPKDATLDQLAEELQKSGAINSKEFFKLYCGLTTEMKFFDPGKYEVEKNLDYEGLINYLQAGDPRETVELLFREGLTILEVANMLEEKGVCKKDDILEMANSDEFASYDMIAKLSGDTEKYYKLEGYLFPDSYSFYKDEDVKSVIGKMLYAFQKRVTKELLEKIEKSGKSMDEIITIASIIQAEAADTKDMYRVSAVINNRLANGYDNGTQMLGCDSTMFYPYNSKSEAPDGYKSKYNTYDIAGLPAGAICNPGVDAIEAAVSPNPDDSDKYYFCHSADGTAYYAATIEQHEENKVAAGLA